jgi:hypothetical protein
MSILWIGSGLAVAAAIGGAYWAGHTAGVDSQAARQQRDSDLVAQAGDAAASAAAAAINKIEVRHVTVRQQLEREVVERAVFRDCRSGPDVVRLFNSTNPAAAAASAPAGDGGMPATPAAGG